MYMYMYIYMYNNNNNNNNNNNKIFISFLKEEGSAFNKAQPMQNYYSSITN